LAYEYLWCNVEGASTTKTFDMGVLLNLLTETEVNQLNMREVVFFDQHYVLQFDVSVADSLTV